MQLKDKTSAIRLKNWADLQQKESGGLYRSASWNINGQNWYRVAQSISKERVAPAVFLETLAKAEELGILEENREEIINHVEQIMLNQFNSIFKKPKRGELSAPSNPLFQEDSQSLKI